MVAMKVIFIIGRMAEKSIARRRFLPYSYVKLAFFAKYIVFHD
jgi:hypothetical protein